MSCLCNSDCNINITNQLESLHATLCKIEQCLGDFAVKLAQLEGRVGDWVPDDASEEEDDWDDDDYVEEDDEGPAPAAASSAWRGSSRA